MKWIVKASAAAVLSRVPGGRAIYHRLQRTLGSNCLNFQESLKRSVEVVDLIREARGTLEGAICLEVGTGWRPFLPVILRLAGAERVFTFDVNPWLDRRYAEETISAIAGRLDEVAACLQLPVNVVRRRFESDDRKDFTSESKSLGECLKRFHIEYRCPADSGQTRLPADSVDYIVSSNVLEHIPPEVLEAIHRESQRILKPSGLMAHRFNPQDHYVAVDGSITGANFLKFSRRQWYWLGGSGLAYHNRLRCAEHRRMVERAGFDIVTERVRIDERAREAIQSGELPVHPDFARFSAEELAADYMWLAASPIKEHTLISRHPAGGSQPAVAQASSERIGSHELV